jgi:acyl carrier protein
MSENIKTDNMNDKLAEVAATVLELEPAEVRDALTPAQVPVWDSFTHVMLITHVEEAFKVKFEPKEATSIRSIGDIRAALRKRGIDI